ncbi:hypothetical protein GS446_24975 [Rhodococcus hoagii]|nr:hypothetical protein [Prescottella equi]
MPIRQLPTTLHNGEQETQTITVLPSQTHSDAAAALDYAQAHCLMIHIEMDPGDWWMTPTRRPACGTRWSRGSPTRSTP